MTEPNDLTRPAAVPAFLTIPEVADTLRMSEATVARWCRAGRLPAAQPGRRWLIRAEAVQRILDGEGEL